MLNSSARPRRGSRDRLRSCAGTGNARPRFARTSRDHRLGSIFPHAPASILADPQTLRIWPAPLLTAGEGARAAPARLPAIWLGMSDGRS